jgi:hypothetical protein
MRVPASPYTLTLFDGIPVVTEVATGKRRRLHRHASGGHDDWVLVSSADGSMVVPYLNNVTQGCANGPF